MRQLWKRKALARVMSEYDADVMELISASSTKHWWICKWTQGHQWLRYPIFPSAACSLNFEELNITQILKHDEHGITCKMCASIYEIRFGLCL